MYFYIIVNPLNRVGFGITGNPRNRLKDYTGAWGEPAAFRFLFKGSKSHIIQLESTIKEMHPDMLLHIEEWKMEWLTSDQTDAQFYEFVVDLIKYRKMPIELLKENVLFENDLKAPL